MTTMKQQIARKQDELNRLKDKDRKLQTGQKIILAGELLAQAKDDPELARYLLNRVEGKFTRLTDQKRIAPLLDEMREWANKG
ncbi:hypothetical protein ACTXMT_13385 [Psychrobacter faecalis]|jgi:hypothetical protein|uniref:hypothetical protein n=1 Tax=Psychrobacter faecalis TaxID=180588 RepID=UPI003FD0AF8B